MQIRKMVLSDYDSVYNLWLNTPGLGVNDINDSKAGIAKYLIRNPDTCFVAEKGDEIIGTILSGHDGRRGLIYHMAVKITERNQGIGESLLTHAINALKDEGIAKVYITIFKDNVVGNVFWEKQGFTIPDESLYRAKEIALIKHIDT